VQTSEWVKAVVPGLIISLMISAAGAYVNIAIQSSTLERTVQAVDKLTDAVNDFKVQMGVFGEKYVTRDHLDQRLRELKQEVKNGT
jgi:hypothetical protein